MKAARIIISLICVMAMAFTITACGGSSDSGSSDTETAGIDIKSGVDYKISTEKNDYGDRVACVSFTNNTGTDWFGLEASFHFITEGEMDDEQKALYDTVKEKLYDVAKESDDDDFDFEDAEITIEGDAIEGLAKDGASGDNVNLLADNYYIPTREDISSIIELDTIKIYWGDGSDLMGSEYDYVNGEGSSEIIDGGKVGIWPDSKEFEDVPEPLSDTYIVMSNEYDTAISVYGIDSDSFNDYKSDLKESGVKDIGSSNYEIGETKSGNSITLSYSKEARIMKIEIDKPE